MAARLTCDKCGRIDGTCLSETECPKCGGYLDFENDETYEDDYEDDDDNSEE